MKRARLMRLGRKYGPLAIQLIIVLVKLAIQVANYHGQPEFQYSIRT